MRVALAFLLSTASVGHAAEQPAGPRPVTLAAGRATTFRVVLPADAPKSVKLASDELRAYVRKATGADLPLAKAGDPADGPVVSLGDTTAAKAAGLSAAKAPAEGFRIAVKGGSLFILGPDTPDGGHTPEGGVSTGTLNGVYDFLENQVGVRWLFPGPDGEDVPKLETITLPADLDRTAAPAFASRLLPYIGTGEKVEEWGRRMRLGRSLKVTHFHNWVETVPAAQFVDHPDWFAEVGGVRVPPVGRYKLETTNPELVAFYAKRAVEAFKAHPDLSCYSLSPTDSGGWSQSAASKALYETDPHGKVSVTPLVLDFYNAVARKVRAEVPDRMVAGYVYAQYLYPPKGDAGGALEPNLFLVCAPSFDYGFTLYRPDVRAEFEAVMAGWGKRTKQLGYYDLPATLVGAGGVPTATGTEILGFVFPKLPGYGVRLVYLSGTDAWGSGGLGNYLKAKLMWDPRADVAALAKDYLARSYGPKAGAVMGQLHAALDAATARHYKADRKASYTLTPDILRGVYAAAYPDLEALFLKAKAAATEPGHAARIGLFERNMLFLHASLRRNGLLADPAKSPLHRTDEQFEKHLAEPATTLATGLTAGGGVAGPALVVRVVDPAPAAPAKAPEPFPHLLRGATRTALHVDRDEEVRVTFSIPKTAVVTRYVVTDSLGRPVAAGEVKSDGIVTFAGRQGQTYALDVTTRSGAYSFRVDGCRYAVQGGGKERTSLHFIAKTTPVYVYVPPGTPADKVAVVLSSESPGETAAADVVSPSGEVVGSLDTSTQPAARLALPAKAKTTTVEAGFWTVRFKKPATGAVDDVFLDITGPAAPWFGLDPKRLLAVDPGK